MTTLSRSAAFLSLLLASGIQGQMLPPGGGGGGGSQPPPPPPGAFDSNGGNSAPSSSGSSSSGGANQGGSAFSNGLPFMDIGNETVAWDGKMWNVTNNRMFRARLEKYLATPEASGPEDDEYRKVLEEINRYLAPTHNGGNPSLPDAVALLPVASQHYIDAKLCDTLANAIYGVWLSQKNATSLRATNEAMKRQVNSMHFFGKHATDPNNKRVSGGAPRGRGGQQQQAQPPAAQSQASSLGTVAQYTKDIVELETRMKANEAAMGLSQVTAKLEFQAIIIQFAIQRRFEHVVMACRFYRHIFQDPSGILQLKEGSDAEKMFASSLGTAPTISALDAFANEAIRDVDEAVVAFDHLLERGDLASASQRISEAFMVGEYLPRVRRVPMEAKLKVLDFTRDGNQLVAAMEMKDYTKAEELVQKLKMLAKDFDYTKPQAIIETARTVSDMQLNKAKVAAMQGDQVGSTAALTEAAQLWPTNPKLREFTNMIGTNADVKTQATLDLDRLLSQRNYRQIYNDQARYIAAVSDDPPRRESLTKVLTDMGRVNLTIAAATSHAQNNNVPGAWEAIEKAYIEFPDDPEITRLRSDFSVRATEFVGALQKGRSHEERQQTGSAMAWYLKARHQYPPSEFAREGINRLVGKLQGGSSGTVE